MKAKKVRDRLILAFLATVFLRSTTNMMQTGLPLLARYRLGLTEQQIGYLMAAITASGFISLIYFGMGKRRIRTLLVAGFLTAAVATVMIPLIQSAPSLLVIGILGFSASSVLQPLLLTSVVFMSEPDVRDRNIAFFTSALSLSLIVGPLLQAFLISATGSFVLSMTFFAPLLFLGALVSTRLSTQDEFEIRPELSSFNFTRNRKYLIGLVTQLVYTIPFAVMLNFGGIFARSAVGASYIDVEFLFGAFFASSFLSRVALSLRGFSKTGAVILSIVLTLAGVPLLALVPGELALAIAFTVLGIPHGLIYPVASSYVAQGVERNKLPMANSVTAAVAGFTNLVSVSFYGYLLSSLGDSVGFLTLEAPVAVLGLLYVVLNLRNTKDTSSLGTTARK
jgi:DHA1 family multidrug resistance protein-like MFS transporter